MPRVRALSRRCCASTAPSATETIGLSALPDGDRSTRRRSSRGRRCRSRRRGARPRPRATSRRSRRSGARSPRGSGSTTPRTADRRRTTPTSETPPTRARSCVRLAETGEAGLGRGAGVLRPSPGRQLRGPGGGGVPRGRHAVRVLQRRPTADGSRAGIYYVNAYELPERPLHHLATTTYHEANPGHHFQLAIEQEIPDRPALRRFGGILAGSAFIEGWGLYSERLADEMGLFEDPTTSASACSTRRRTARRGSSSTPASTRWGGTATARSRSWRRRASRTLDAVIEIDRYIALPGQALSYMIGQLEIERWRRSAEAREGSAFSLSRLPRPAARARLAAAAVAAARDG